ncbi:MAG: FecR domain-containing protein [Gammaproteobacteria bacterium]
MNRIQEGPAGTDAQRFAEATEWFMSLRERAEPAELVEAWLEWCNADVRNREAFEEVRSVWSVTGSMPLEGLDFEAPRSTVADIPGAVLPEVSTRPPRRHLPDWRRRAAVFLAAACVAGLALTAAIAWLPRASLRSVTPTDGTVTTIATAQSQHRSVLLADGSRIELAGDSAVTATLREHSREIELRGEAYFKVAHDKTRPFIVHAGGLHVRAVGTSFDVRATDDRVVVGVEEGVVIVEPPPGTGSPVDRIIEKLLTSTGKRERARRLQPVPVRGGQEVALGAPGEELQILPIEPTAVASWREGRLRFAREPLRSVLASIRAATGRDIALEDPELGELRFTGTVFSSRVDAWVEGLPAIFPLSVRQEGAQLVIRARE